MGALGPGEIAAAEKSLVDLHGALDLPCLPVQVAEHEQDLEGFGLLARDLARAR